MVITMCSIVFCMITCAEMCGERAAEVLMRGSIRENGSSSLPHGRFRAGRKRRGWRAGANARTEHSNKLRNENPTSYGMKTQ